MNPPQKQPAQSMRTFTIVWFGQFVSLVGSGLTSFALGVWVYQTTSSVMQFAAVMLFTTLPAIIVAPIAGLLADRYDRRLIMIASDSLAALSTLGIGILAATGQLEIWHIYVARVVFSIADTLQTPAAISATSLLVSKENYGRANGMIQLSSAATTLVVPMLAGALLGLVQLPGIIAIDFVTFMFSLTTLALVRFPQPPARPAVEAEATAQPALQRFLQDLTQGWTYIAARPGLLGLLVFQVIFTFGISFINVLSVPLVLSLSNETVLGFVGSASGLGLLLGSAIMTAWAGPKRRVYGVLGATMIYGLFLSLMGVQPNVWLIGAAVTIALVFVPMLQGWAQAIWQTKVQVEVQGRVFATLQTLRTLVSPLAFLLAGPLADNVFEPLMAVNGPLASTLGQVIGTGPGRGIGLFLIVLGLSVLLTGGGGFLYPPLRNLDTELPDAPHPAAPPEHAETAAA